MEKIVEAIKETVKKISGSYGVILYDKKTKNLYYFKDRIINFYICKYGKILCGSSSDRNLDYLYFGKKNKENYVIEGGKIYLIKNEEEEPIIELCYIDEDEQKRADKKLKKAKEKMKKKAEMSEKGFNNKSKNKKTRFIERFRRLKGGTKEKK
jgi:hypothetical protein